jgi:hypothetical protein
MDLRPESLLIFLFCILPGAIAQRAKNSLVPPSLDTPTAVSEIGDYLLTSAWVHLPALLLFRTVLLWTNRAYLDKITSSLRSNGIDRVFLMDHWKLVFMYFLVVVIGGYFFGLVRGYQIHMKRIQRALFKKLGLSVSLEDRTVWSLVMEGDRAEDYDTWVEAELKDDRGFYSGRIKTSPLVANSERNKDFYLRPASFKPNRNAQYEDLPNNAGVLLTFAEVISVRVIRLRRPTEPLAK